MREGGADMRKHVFKVVALAAAVIISQEACGSNSNTAPAPQAAANVPDVKMVLYDGIGNGARIKMSAQEPTNDCDARSPNLGTPSGNPNEDQICEPAPRDFADAITNPDCPCGIACLTPYFDHNKNRSPEGTVQLYTPPASRRYYPGVPSAKHWENGVTQNIFTYDIQLTNFYGYDLTNVAIVLVEIAPDEGRQGFQDARPHACLNNQYAIWTFGNVAAGETVTRTVKLWLPNDAGFTVTGFVLSLSGAACEASLSDADGDGLDNAEEIALGTDPNDPDTDGDGLFDNAEDDTGSYVNWWATGTDPLARDTDGDCFSDGTEIAENFNPLSAASHPARKCNKADLTNPKP